MGPTLCFIFFMQKKKKKIILSSLKFGLKYVLKIAFNFLYAKCDFNIYNLILKPILRYYINSFMIAPISCQFFIFDMKYDLDMFCGIFLTRRHFLNVVTLLVLYCFSFVYYMFIISYFMQYTVLFISDG